MKKYECHVISNTHWDREWVKSFQESRISLMDMFDKLFEVFENDPGFTHYHLDSQSIPLEDYCAIKPGNKNKLTELVRSGRLLVGPWYTLPEMNSIDGECIVRNLLTGHRTAKEYGRVMKVGYTPTSTGQVSQLPQIYAGFGIRTIIFYRGINQDVAPAEYIWKSPDGTESFGIRPPQHFSRCTFWGYVYLPVIHKYYDHIENSKQNYWHEGGFTFRMAEANDNEFIELDPVKFFDESYLRNALEKLMSEITKHTDSNVLLALHGHDASFPHEETPSLIKILNGLSEETFFIHSSLPAYASAIEGLVKKRKDNVVLHGEMRHVNQSQPWNDAHLYPGVLSTKGRLKRRNREVENVLIRHAEPAASMAHMAGGLYETEILDAAWKLVLANHAHDTINACSLDAVYHDAMHRYKQAEDLSRQVIKRSMARIVKNINLGELADDSVFLTVFNLSPHKRSGVAKIVLDMPHDMQAESISLIDPDGHPVDIQPINSYSHKLHVDKVGFGKTHHSLRFEAWAFFHDLPAMGYKTYIAKPSHDNKKQQQGMADGQSMENDFLRVSIEADGSLTVLDKETGASYQGLNTFMDEGELGNAWTPGRIPGGEVYHTRGNPAVIECLENGPVQSSFRVNHTMTLPVSSADSYKKRSGTMKKVSIVSVITLQKGLKYIRVETTFDNTVRDHRLRALFPSGIQADKYFAAMPFDVVNRPVPKKSDPSWTEVVDPSDPNTGFIGTGNTARGIAITNIGLYESEVFNDEQRTIAITLLRCFYQHGNWTRDRWPDEEFQNPGRHSFTYAICPFAGPWNDANLHGLLPLLDNPLKAVQHGKGTPGRLPLKHSFLQIPEGLQLSCIKQAEEGDGLIIRVYNPNNQQVEGYLHCAGTIRRASFTDLEELETEELPTDGQSIKLDVAHHKIITIKLLTGQD